MRVTTALPLLTRSTRPTSAARSRSMPTTTASPLLTPLVVPLSIRTRTASGSTGRSITSAPTGVKSLSRPENWGFLVKPSIVR